MTSVHGDSVPEDSSTGEVTGNLAVPPMKTPLFQAIHAARYQRQALIREIQEETNSKLICYVSGVDSSVDRGDIVCFVDLLHNIAPGESVDLLLHTGGGDIDAAEKLITMLRTRVGASRLRVAVPHYAKSAGTLIALGANSIVMSDTSELGPIDPQIVRSDNNGDRLSHSVKNYLDAYEDYCEKLKKNPDDVVARVMLSQLDPSTVRLFQSVMERAREFAEKQLRSAMMKEEGNWSQAVRVLLNTTRFWTHGQPISWQDAQDEIGLTIEYMEPTNPLWLKFWQVYCRQMLAVGDREKLFESEIASLIIDSRAATP
jgi:hypothetical protein